MVLDGQQCTPHAGVRMGKIGYQIGSSVNQILHNYNKRRVRLRIIIIIIRSKAAVTSI